MFCNRHYELVPVVIANKRLVQTAPALCNFSIRARHNRFGGGVGAFLPHRARVRLHNLSVSCRNLSGSIFQVYLNQLSFSFLLASWQHFLGFTSQQSQYLKFAMLTHAILVTLLHSPFQASLCCQNPRKSVFLSAYFHRTFNRVTHSEIGVEK
jgi:hypothetical protein